MTKKEKLLYSLLFYGYLFTDFRKATATGLCGEIKISKYSLIKNNTIV